MLLEPTLQIKFALLLDQVGAPQLVPPRYASIVGLLVGLFWNVYPENDCPETKGLNGQLTCTVEPSFAGGI